MNKLIKEIEKFVIENNLSLSHSNAELKDYRATFCDDQKFVAEINNNRAIKAVITNSKYAKLFKSKVIWVCEDPRFLFFLCS